MHARVLGRAGGLNGTLVSVRSCAGAGGSGATGAGEQQVGTSAPPPYYLPARGDRRRISLFGSAARAAKNQHHAERPAKSGEDVVRKHGGDLNGYGVRNGSRSGTTIRTGSVVI